MRTVEERQYVVRATGGDTVKSMFRDIDEAARATDRDVAKIGQTAQSTGGHMERMGRQSSSGLSGIAALAKRAGGTVLSLGRTFVQAAVNVAKWALVASVAFGMFGIKLAADRDAVVRGMAVIMGSMEAAQKQFERLRTIALQPGATLEGALRLDISLQSVGMSADLAASAVEQFANALALTGATNPEEMLGRVGLALQQIIGKGKVSAEEINQLAEAIPQVRKVMSEVFGTADTEAIQKMGIGAAEFVTRLTEGFKALPRAADTFSNKLINLGAGLKELAIAFGEGALGAEGGGLLDALGKGMEWLAPLARSLGQSFASLLPHVTAFIESMSDPAKVEKFLTRIGEVAHAAGTVFVTLEAIVIKAILGISHTIGRLEVSLHHMSGVALTSASMLARLFLQPRAAAELHDAAIIAALQEKQRSREVEAEYAKGIAAATTMIDAQRGALAKGATAYQHWTHAVVESMKATATATTAHEEMGSSVDAATRSLLGQTMAWRGLIAAAMQGSAALRSAMVGTGATGLPFAAAGSAAVADAERRRRQAEASMSPQTRAAVAWSRRRAEQESAADPRTRGLTGAARRVDVLTRERGHVQSWGIEASPQHQRQLTDLEGRIAAATAANDTAATAQLTAARDALKQQIDDNTAALERQNAAALTSIDAQIELASAQAYLADQTRQEADRRHTAGLAFYGRPTGEILSGALREIATLGKIEYGMAEAAKAKSPYGPGSAMYGYQQEQASGLRGSLRQQGWSQVNGRWVPPTGLGGMLPRGESGSAASREPVRVRVQIDQHEQAQAQKRGLQDALSGQVIGNLGSGSEAMLSQARIMSEQQLQSQQLRASVYGSMGSLADTVVYAIVDATGRIVRELPGMVAKRVDEQVGHAR